MSYRCPRNKMVTSQEVCAARKGRKHHGCVSCTYPRQVERDLARIAGLRVRVNLEPKTATARNNPIEIRGLTGPTIALSKAVARDLYQKLQAAVNGGM
ncbi:hypothetical protein DFAR_1720002 [Desulfarculales bacterium]